MLLVVKGGEFIKKLKRLSHKTGTPLRLTRQGKGSHIRLYYGAREATMPDAKRELKTGTFRAICRQLGIDPRDL